MTAPRAILIGTAGWAIPAANAAAFPGAGSHLERYAAVLPAVEINSSFHRPHRRSTYERWAASTPDDFRFSVKIPKEISHTRRLVRAEEPLERFADEVAGLGGKLRVLLLQLPPKFAFDPGVADAFFRLLRHHFDAAIACEPRNQTWFAADAEACLTEHRVARVAADPVLVPGGERPGGWPGLRYRRLHGAPRVYYSSYEAERLATLAAEVAAEAAAVESWCIFDNTASGAATGDVLTLRGLLAGDGQGIERFTR